MAPPHIPIASRLESARRQRVSGLGYDAVIKGARSPLIGAAGRPASGPGKAPCRFPGETSDLGYNDVVERCDSVDLGSIDFEELQKGCSPQKRQQASGGMPVETIDMASRASPAGLVVRKSRMVATRPASANEAQRTRHVTKGLSLTPQVNALHARPSGSGPSLDESSSGPPRGPQVGIGPNKPSTRRTQEDVIRDDRAEGMPARQGDRTLLTPHAERARMNGRTGASSGSSLESVLRAKESEVDHLNSLLIRQAEEKRNIERQRYKLAAENVNLRGEVERMRTRQRPYSASSTGSRDELWYDQHHPEMPSPSMHTIQEQAQKSLHLAVAQRPPSGHVRPASALHPSTRTIRPQGLVRKHPVFGQDSLLHRSVYAPEGDPLVEHQIDVVDSRSSQKDELFLRPDAYRTLKGAGPRQGSAARTRPQSANAAVRQINARPSSGATRPGSARPRSSYAERLMHADADEFAGFHKPLPSQDVTQRAIHILAFMRSAAGKKHVRVMDFMATFDKLKRGHISCNEFRRSLESCACFGDISEEEYNLVFSFFLHESTKDADVLSPTSRISYMAFCEVLQPAGNKGVKLNVDQQVLKEIGQSKQTSKQDSALATNELSPEGEAKLRTLMTRMLETIAKARIPVRDFVQHLDPRPRPGSASGNHSTGCMSRSQYLRIIRSASLGINFSDEELALLFCKYDRNGEFNYYRFCRDIEAAEQE